MQRGSPLCETRILLHGLGNTVKLLSINTIGPQMTAASKRFWNWGVIVILYEIYIFEIRIGYTVKQKSWKTCQAAESTETTWTEPPHGDRQHSTLHIATAGQAENCLYKKVQ